MNIRPIPRCGHTYCAPEVCRFANTNADIVTSYDRPPIPTKAFDWSARRKDYDGAPDAGPSASRIGHGPTEADAIRDLLEQEHDR